MTTKQRDIELLSELIKLHRISFYHALQLEKSIYGGSFSFSKWRREIVHGAARSAYVHSWVEDKQRKHDDEGAKLPWPKDARRIDDYAPKGTPQKAAAWAEMLIQKYESEAEMPIEILYWLAERAEGDHYKKPTPNDFGAYLERMASGSAVSWFDDHPDFEPLESIDFISTYYG